MDNKCYSLINGTLVTPYRVLPNSGLVIEGSKIKNLFSMDSFHPHDGTEVFDVKGAYIAPGFIDMHLHGGGGADVMDGTPEAFATIAKAHAKGGTTSIVPSTTTSSLQDLKNALAAFQQALKMKNTGSRLLGMHLEGPYFAPSQKGAQDIRFIKEPHKDEYLSILDSFPGIVRISAAPELPGGLELGRELRRRGVLASIGHTDASYDEVLLAIEAGYSHVTHLYSGMSGVHRVRAYRIAGVIESGLLLDDLTVEIIADGKHLPASLLKLIYKCKGPDRIALCSDSIRAAGMPEGEYILGNPEDGQVAVVDEGVAWLPDRTAFAGSVATANLLVRNMVNLAGVSLLDAVKMATLTPARILKIDDVKGSIDKGKDADIVVFDEDINVRMTIVEGKLVYQA
ncbi:MAG TPA: N-acetylglucosamine-6-phosphate deacetylase [Bacillota bacterium]|nr:N-acetylglucosamine-6-phosphate deacetylase [Bacillota bacterium]